MAKYLAVAGEDRKTIEGENQTVAEILAANDIEVADGATFVVADKEVSKHYKLEDGQTLVYVPPVGLGQ